MKVYISGKMTGLPDLGRQHFENTARMLADVGHVVLNPGALPVGLSKQSYMPMCLAMLEAADAIYMLHNWMNSPGAILERMYAEYQGKAVYYETSVRDHEKLFTRKRKERKT